MNEQNYCVTFYRALDCVSLGGSWIVQIPQIGLLLSAAMGALWIDKLGDPAATECWTKRFLLSHIKTNN